MQCEKEEVRSLKSEVRMKKHSFVLRRARAFTLLEMLFVFILIGLLASLVTVNARHYLVKGKQNAARAEISSICTALETFNSTFGRYPTNEENLAILSQKSEKFPDPLLKQIPVDPWGHPYQYNTPGKRDAYEVISFGADGHSGGTGADADISSTNLKEPASTR
jgi:general secretion pathway protein G